METRSVVTQDMIQAAEKMAEDVAPEQIPSLLVNACIGRKPQVAGVPDEMVTDQAPSEEGSTTKGLILSEENIISIERYKRFGLNLPVTEAAVIAALHYNDDSPKNESDKDGDDKESQKEQEKRYTYSEEDFPAAIRPGAFVTLNTTIKNHCSQWTGLRNQIILLGVSLNIFSQKFIGIGSDISEVIRAMPVVCRATTKLKDFDASFTWSEDDVELKGVAIELIMELKRQVLRQQEKTHTLVTQLEQFRSVMENDVVPGVSQMNAVLMDMEQSDERAELLAQMEELRKEIESLDKQYKQLVGYAFTGAAAMVFPPAGVITWAITGGVFGDKAEKVRKQRAKCQAKRDKLKDALKAREYLATFVTRTHDEVTRQSVIIDDALVGVKNLEVMWGAIARYIDDSAEELEAINEAQRLILFVRHLDSAVDSWKEVRDITGELNDLFNRAENKAHEIGMVDEGEVHTVSQAFSDGEEDAKALNQKPEEETTCPS